MAVDMADLRMKVENEIKSCLGMGGTRVLDLNTMYCYHMGFCVASPNPAGCRYFPFEPHGTASKHYLLRCLDDVSEAFFS